MTPEEYYYRNKLEKYSQQSLFEMRVKSLEWMLSCFNEGTIRRNTIVNLIPLASLYELIHHMEGEERYEDCQIIKTVIDTIYEHDKKSNMSLKRKKEIIRLLENTIRTESEKKGGGNRELIVKLSNKLEDVRESKPTKKS
jgi:hypothetical protein|tara:strand:- start:16 stop:435 length:420 start_codon:yes stop_codon:yes gene_type:complete